MSKDRREFLKQSALGLAGAAAVTQTPPELPPGAPPAFGTGPKVGPDVTPQTFAEAEKLMQVTMTPAQRQMAAQSWRTSMAALFERRTGPRTIALEPTLSPATRWTPIVAGEPTPKADHFTRSTGADLRHSRSRSARFGASSLGAFFGGFTSSAGAPRKTSTG